MKEIDQLRMLTESLSLLETTLAKYSYRDDFLQIHPNMPMQWSIYKDGTTDGDYDKWVLDFTTDAPDGTWPVMFDFDGNDNYAEGVRVRGGAFDIPPTMKAIHEVVQDASYWGTYIERMEWDPEMQCFHVTIGS